MKKLKFLPPTLRESKRYLLINAPQKKVEKAILNFIGILGWSKAGPQFIKANSHLILSVERKSLDDTRTALELAGINVLGVSGTINKLKQKFLKPKA
ncbi:ribonuclease P protein component 2 [Nanoarchaeota archaeon]